MKWTSRLATEGAWTAPISNREAKEAVAAEIAALARAGDTIGVGSGSTSYLALCALGRRVAEEGLACTFVCTSAEVTLTCASLGLTAATLLAARPDWCFDGADEVDPEANLIKGRGGAMFREKMLMAACARRYIIIDASKRVAALGEKFAIPVEVNPEAVHFAELSLTALGAESVALRMAVKKDGPVLTEYGNLILDARFKDVGPTLERDIKCVPGVIESGLFQGYAPELVMA